MAFYNNILLPQTNDLLNQNDTLGTSSRVTTSNTNQGLLQVQTLSRAGHRPIENARIRISYTGNPTSIIEELRTNREGNTEVLTLDTPPLEYSLEPQENQPYSE